MGRSYDQYSDLIKLSDQEQRQRNRKEFVLLLWIVVNLAWIMMVFACIAIYYLYQMFTYS